MLWSCIFKNAKLSISLSDGHGKQVLQEVIYLCGVKKYLKINLFIAFFCTCVLMQYKHTYPLLGSIFTAPCVLQCSLVLSLETTCGKEKQSPFFTSSRLFVPLLRFWQNGYQIALSSSYNETWTAACRRPAHSIFLCGFKQGMGSSNALTTLM